MVKKEIKKESKSQTKKDFTNHIFAYSLENALEHPIAAPNIILPKLFQHGLEKEQIKDILPKINEIVNLVNKMPKDQVKKEFEKYSEYVKDRVYFSPALKELPNVSKNMVFRLAPFPSGALHLGNTKTYLLNALYAEKYNAKVLLVMDDTVGSEEKKIMPEAYKLIQEAFQWLKVKYKKPIIYKSDRLEIYYKYAEDLIKKNKAYVCSCKQEEIKENRVAQRECSCRQFPVSEQLLRWKKMFKSKQGEYVLRIKTSMQDPNPAFRDRVLFRISERYHPKVGNKYKVWPMLEFSWAIDDHLLGVTHIIRGKELMIEGDMENYIWDIFGWKRPNLIHCGLIKLEGIGGKLSKSKAQREVLSGDYSGWDDPRTWSVQSLRRRGILQESIREFVEKIGLNQNEITVPVDDLYSINRKKLDSEAKRYFFVQDPVSIEITNAPQIKRVQTKYHPEKPKTKDLLVGKEIFVSLKDFNKFKGKQIRLMYLYNIKLDKQSEFTFEENKPEIPKIHWVSKGLKTKVMMPEGTYVFGLSEENISKLKIGEIIQFERFGFCRLDNFDKKKKEYEFWFTHN
ncbi:MAG TPA: glutamate--tRNA ligase [Candidatus Paceibacterota bacterium]|nr:glutamate--tRNA ligase [Candidatus Paceibacterota bacterium]